VQIKSFSRPTVNVHFIIIYGTCYYIISCTTASAYRYTTSRFKGFFFFLFFIFSSTLVKIGNVVCLIYIYDHSPHFLYLYAFHCISTVKKKVERPFVNELFNQLGMLIICVTLWLCTWCILY